MFHPFEEFIKDLTRYTETTHDIFLLHDQEQFWKPKVRLFEQKPASERFQADYRFRIPTVTTQHMPHIFLTYV